MTPIGLTLVDADAAADWTRGSLAQGSDLSMLVSQRLREMPIGIVVGPESASDLSLDHGQGIATADADVAVRRLLDAMARLGAKTLVVEDDLARRGDAGLPAEVVFVGARVLRWIQLDRGPAAASRLLRTGSSGYPLNAFVCDREPSELRLAAEHVLNDSEVRSLAESTSAVITTAYDAESYLLLAAEDPPGGHVVRFSAAFFSWFLFVAFVGSQAAAAAPSRTLWSPAAVAGSTIYDATSDSTEAGLGVAPGSISGHVSGVERTVRRAGDLSAAQMDIVAAETGIAGATRLSAAERATAARLADPKGFAR